MKKRFLPHGHLALTPQAFGMVFDLDERDPARAHDSVAVVAIRGPLMHHKTWFWDSYDEIRERVQEAFAQSPKAVLLSIDSPGGLVSGCFELARDLRTMAKEAGVPLHAYVDGQATSAAYALACGAEKIWVSDTSTVGSIGVIEGMVDVTANDEAMGVRYAFIVSGARKGDGNPHVPLTDEAIATAQTRVDTLAEMFFGLVAEARSLDANKIRKLEAAIMHGAEAKKLGLADEIATFDSVLARLAKNEDDQEQTRGQAMGIQASNDYEDAIAKLRKAAEGDDDEAKKAKKMLAAMDDDEDKKDDESKAEDDDKKDEEAADDCDDDKAVAARAERAAARAEASERNMLISSRADLDEATVALLASTKTPIETVRGLVKTLPRANKRHVPALEVEVTRGEGQGDGSAARLPPDQKHQLDIAMGLVPMRQGVVHDGNRLVLGAAVPVKND